MINRVANLSRSKNRNISKIGLSGRNIILGKVGYKKTKIKTTKIKIKREGIKIKINLKIKISKNRERKRYGTNKNLMIISIQPTKILAKAMIIATLIISHCKTPKLSIRTQ